MRKAAAILVAFLAATAANAQSADAPTPGKPEIIATGMGFVEGPSVAVESQEGTRWSGTIYVVDNSQPEGVIWAVRRKSAGARAVYSLAPWVKVGKPGNNGSALGSDGWLYVTSPRQRAVLRARRRDSRDIVEWLVRASESLALNGPNDLVLRRNGDIYFTDPAWPRGKPGAVYLRRRSGEVLKVIPDIRTPNGIGLSPDERFLYVAQSGPDKIVRCEIRPDGTVGPPVDFIKFTPPSLPDGMCIARDGTIYQALYRGRAVAAVSPQGKLLWRVALDWDIADKTLRGFGVTNCTLGPDGLYLTRTNGGGKKNNGCLIRLPLNRGAR